MRISSVIPLFNNSMSTESTQLTSNSAPINSSHTSEGYSYLGGYNGVLCLLSRRCYDLRAKDGAQSVRSSVQVAVAA